MVQRQMQSGQPEYYPLYKICPVVNTLTTTFQDVYRPVEALTIDETICPYRVLICFRIYMKGSPINTVSPFLKCANWKEYVFTFEMYTGANPNSTVFNSSFNVIDRLCSLVKNRGHTIYMDRWFSSPKHFGHVWACSTKAVGTVMHFPIN
jgi:hypothetical protein